MITTIDRIKINQFTQDIYTIDQMTNWFDEKDAAAKLEYISELLYMIKQAHPNDADVQEAILKSQIRNGSSALMIIKNSGATRINEFYKLKELQGKESVHAWIILLWLLKIADTRRKTNENQNECNHWWHKDLSNDEYISWLVNGYKE